MAQLTEFGYVGLFIAAFLAATILPFSSEVALSALLLNGLSPTMLVLVATTGNVLGSVTNFALGYWASQWERGRAMISTWLKMSNDKLEQAQQRFGKYGLVALCFAWVPVIGDPLTVVAGMLRVKFMWFLVLVTLGKCLRYVAVSYVVLHI